MYLWIYVSPRPVYLSFNTHKGNSITYNIQERHLSTNKPTKQKEDGKCSCFSKSDPKIHSWQYADTICSHDTPLTLNNCFTSGDTELLQSIRIRTGSCSWFISVYFCVDTLLYSVWSPHKPGGCPIKPAI